MPVFIYPIVVFENMLLEDYVIFFFNPMVMSLSH